MERIARQALQSLPGVRPGPDGRWRACSPDEDRAVALVSRTTGPHPAHDLLLEIGAAPIAGGRIGSAFGGPVAPERPMASSALLAAGVDPARLARGISLDEILSRLAPLLPGATLVVFDSDRPAAFLNRALRDRGREEEPVEVLPLAPALRRAGLLPLRGGLDKAAAALRVPVPESEEPEDHARAVAAIWLAALDRGVVFRPPRPRPRFDFGRVGFGPELLQTVPAAPGIYRFQDREGTVLYVGKSRDLRSRIASYFTHRSRRRRLYAELMEKVWRFTFEETGSELAALLAEVKAIREEAPPYNVVTGVRRRRPASGDLALFLPGRSGNTVEILLVREGRPAGRIQVDSRAPEMESVRAALESALGAPPPEEEDPADAEIVTSWLRQKGGEQNLLDLSETGTIEDAMEKIEACIRDPDLFRRKFYRR